MDEKFEYDLTRARLLVMRKKWNEARPLLEALRDRNPADREAAELLLRVEKEQAFIESEKWRSEDAALPDKTIAAMLAAGAALVFFMFYGGYKTVTTVHDSGWRSDVIIESGISNVNRPFERKLPTLQMLWIVPLSGVVGGWLLWRAAKDIKIS